MKEIAPVLLIFFNRVDTLEITFEQIKKAKPRKLYLAQDGPRNELDVEKIIECRKIVENIDWECEVFKNYSEENHGCGRGPQRAINWFFENEEEGIILEDDCVASQSFFSYCTEMLEKYRDDERIFLVAGCNFELQTTEVDTSYFFGYAGTNWGWATWKRNWDKMDYSCSWIKDNAIKESVYSIINKINKNAAKREIAEFENTNALVEKGENISYWDAQWQSIRYINHQLSIIPQRNLISNIGVGQQSTHAKSTSKSNIEKKVIGKISYFFNPTFEFEGDLIHPEYVIENIAYDKNVYARQYRKTFKGFVKRCMRGIKKIFKR